MTEWLLTQWTLFKLVAPWLLLGGLVFILGKWVVDSPESETVFERATSRARRLDL
jgi:hypothetical protein